MKRCPNPKCDSSEDSLEILEDERCTRNRCCWVHCDWCGVSGPTAGPSDESAIEAWDMLPRITEENYDALKDEFNRGAALAQQHCPKAPLGHSVFEGIPLLAAEVERLKTKFNEERESEFRRYCVSAEAYEKEAIRLKETIKTAQADGAEALVASFENVDPKARICELEAEVARLKEAVKRLPELTWKAERYEAICDIFGYARGSDVGPAVESVKKEWAQLRSGTTISVEQAKEASQLASQAAAVHTIRACAQWLRKNGRNETVVSAATVMELHMTQNVNQTYGTPDMCVPSKVKEGIHYLEVSKPEFDALCARVEALEQKSSLAVEWERRRIIAWIEKQVERYSEDTMRNEKECALARNVLRMLAAQIRGGEHHDVSL